MSHSVTTTQLYYTIAALPFFLTCAVLVLSPCGPMSPLGPAGPSPPWGPTEPNGPGGPLGPTRPSLPSLPGVPLKVNCTSVRLLASNCVTSALQSWRQAASRSEAEMACKRFIMKIVLLFFSYGAPFILIQKDPRKVCLTRLANAPELLSALLSKASIIKFEYVCCAIGLWGRGGRDRLD